jgi:uncharacterized protein DUF4333
MRSRLGRLAAIAFVALLAAGCSKTLNTTELEDELKSQLETQLAATGIEVDCPDDIAAEAGATFSCTATNSDGSTLSIEVTQGDDEGNVTWEIVGAGSP